ncbi:MAG TPA: hypothetical protein VHV51_11750, partial [Polyangiaceae bacterium]|nr:hypothetical protein [Polyangiaceae bacterium]
MTGEAAPRIERVSAPTNKRLLWILFIAPATWAVQEGLSTFVAVRACDLGRPALGRGLIIALGVAALAVTLGTSIAGHRALRRDNSGEPIRRVEGR